jgi:Cu-Zn family superoxide dismutase
MRQILTVALGAALLFGCSDDDDGDDLPPGDGAVRDATVGDASLDAAPNIDAGDAGLDGGAQRAAVTLESKSGSNTTGTATFSVVDGAVTLTLTVRGATPGLHGAHLHAVGDCSAANASSAGDHWNPEQHPHGSGTQDAGPSHLGDLGNVTVQADGVGTLTFSNPEWKLGDRSPWDVLGKALVIHADPDDLMTQSNPDAGVTPGKSGSRIACGVIEAD